MECAGGESAITDCLEDIQRFQNKHLSPGSMKNSCFSCKAQHPVRDFVVGFTGKLGHRMETEGKPIAGHGIQHQVSCRGQVSWFLPKPRCRLHKCPASPKDRLMNAN